MAEDLLRRLLSCAEAESGGVSSQVRQRRRRLIEYWYASQVHRYRDEGRTLDAEWHEEVMRVFVFYADACDRFFDGPDFTGVDAAEAGRVTATVWQTIQAVDQALAPYDEAVSRGDRFTADSCIHQALSELFDWDENRRIRAYIYALTGEVLTDAQVKTEKSRLLDALDRCRDRLAADIDTLLG
jgi:hypothetical protein